jgi:hypothetical protein
MTEQIDIERENNLVNDFLEEESADDTVNTDTPIEPPPKPKKSRKKKDTAKVVEEAQQIVIEPIPEKQKKSKRKHPTEEESKKHRLEGLAKARGKAAELRKAEKKLAQEYFVVKEKLDKKIDLETKLNTIIERVDKIPQQTMNQESVRPATTLIDRWNAIHSKVENKNHDKSNGREFKRTKNLNRIPLFSGKHNR